LSNSSYPSEKNRFRAIYSEKSAVGYEVTDEILRALPGTPVIQVDSYKDILNRPRQNARRQKDFPALILAVKKPPFLYPGPEVCQRFGAEFFAYSSLLLGCPFDCEYCFLQGMYPCSYCVAFVNVSDFADAIKIEADRHKSMLLALSYDTDLLAFDTTFSYIRALSGALSEVPGLTVEIRTKCASTSLYRRIEPSANRVFAFSLSPQHVIDRYEHRAPALSARLRAARAAMDCGHPVRLCFDPVFVDRIPDGCYEAFFEQVFSILPAERILDVSYGFFRMNRTFFGRVAKVRQDSLLFASDFEVEGDVVSIPAKVRVIVSSEHLNILTRYLPKEKIFEI
jgi:spore photoproduct lyase